MAPSKKSPARSLLKNWKGETSYAFFETFDFLIRLRDSFKEEMVYSSEAYRFLLEGLCQWAEKGAPSDVLLELMASEVLDDVRGKITSPDLLLKIQQMCVDAIERFSKNPETRLKGMALLQNRRVISQPLTEPPLPNTEKGLTPHAEVLRWGKTLMENPEALETYQHFQFENLASAAQGAGKLFGEAPPEKKLRAVEQIKRDLFPIVAQVRNARGASDAFVEMSRALVKLGEGISMKSRREIASWIQEKMVPAAAIINTMETPYYRNRSLISCAWAIARICPESAQLDQLLRPLLGMTRDVTPDSLEWILEIHQICLRQLPSFSWEFPPMDAKGFSELRQTLALSSQTQKKRHALFIGLWLSPSQMAAVLGSKIFIDEEKFFMLSGFFQTHKGKELDFDYRSNLNLAAPRFETISALKDPFLRDKEIAALGRQQTKSAFQKLKKMFLQSEPEIQKKILCAAGGLRLSEVDTWLLEHIQTHPGEVLTALTFYYQSLMKQNTGQETAQDWKEKMGRRMLLFPLTKWNQVEKFLEGMTAQPLEPALILPLVRLLVVGLRLQIQLDQGFTQQVEFENLPPAFRVVLGKMLRAEKMNQVYSDLRRLIKMLPISSHLITQLRQASETWNRAIYGGEDAWRGTISRLREEIHNRPNPRHLQVARAYRNYLFSKGAQTDALARLGYSISPGDPTSFEILQNNGRLPLVNETLDQLITLLEAVYGDKSVNRFLTTLGVLQREFPSGHPLLTLLQNLLQRITPQTKISDKTYLIHFDSLSISNLLDLMDLLVSIRTEAEKGMRKADEHGLLLAQLDIDMDALFYQFVSRLLAQMSEKGAPQTQITRALLQLMQLVQTQVPGEDLAEIGMIEKELEAARHANQFPRRRYYSILQRLNRLICKITGEMLQTYQFQAEEYAKLMGMKSTDAADFAANLLREEAVYQLSLLLQRIEEETAEELQIQWMVTRPGIAEGFLVSVPESARLQKIIYMLKEPAILVVDEIPQDTILNKKVRGLITREEEGVLSHVAIRAAQVEAVVVRPLGKKYAEIKKRAEENPHRWMRLEADVHGVSLSPRPKAVPAKGEDKAKAKAIVMPLKPDLSYYRIKPINRVHTQNRVGKKAKMMVELASLVGEKTVPQSVCVPFGYFKKIMELKENENVGKKIRKLQARLTGRNKRYRYLDQTLQELRETIEQLKIPDSLVGEVKKNLGEGPYMVRSTTNAEDLPDYPGAGLYESVAQVTAAGLPAAVKRVYQSLYSEKAFYDRHRVQMNEMMVYPAVLIQQMVKPQYSFVIHTQDPTGNPEDILIELVAGLGESLVSGAQAFQGAPHRFRLRKKGLFFDVERVSYANKSFRVEAMPEGGTERQLMDYTQDPLSQNEFLPWLNSIGEIALKLQRHYQGPQDIEGAVEWGKGGSRIWLFQCRSQLSKPHRSSSKDAVPRVSKIGAEQNSSLSYSL